MVGLLFAIIPVIGLIAAPFIVPAYFPELAAVLPFGSLAPVSKALAALLALGLLAIASPFLLDGVRRIRTLLKAPVIARRRGFDSAAQTQGAVRFCNTVLDLGRRLRWDYHAGTLAELQALCSEEEKIVLATWLARAARPLIEPMRPGR